MFYKTDEFQCKSNIGRECPPATIGTGPDCLCIEKRKEFIESVWNCLEYLVVPKPYSPPFECPNRSQKYPQCSGIDPSVLKSLIG